MMGTRRRQRGVALLVVLWACALLAILLGGFAMLARTEALQTRYQVAHAQALYAAEAGVARAVYQLRGVPPQQRWVPDGRIYRMHFGPAQVRIALTDASGKVDLDAATPQVLMALFRAHGLDRARAEALAAAVMDWRDPDSATRPHGAEAPQYRAAGRDYGPRNGPFRSLPELQQVLGMTPALYQALAPDLSVWSGRNMPDPAFASATVLATLPGMNLHAARQFVARRRATRRADEARLRLPNGTPIVAGNGGIVDSIRSEATLANGTRAIVHCTIRLRGTRTVGKPYVVLDWRLGDRASADAGAVSSTRFSRRGSG